LRDSVYKGEVKINYILKKPNVPSDVLVVAFPAGLVETFTASSFGYTYIFAISSLKVNGLFLKMKDELQSGWMTVSNRDFAIERTIVKLIRRCKRQTGAKRVIVVGSSFGGHAAVYYGLKYGWEIIAGGIPYKTQKKYEVRNAAGKYSKEDKIWLNGLLPRVIRRAGRKGYDKRIFLSWGIGENLNIDKNQGPLMRKHLDQAGIKYDLKYYNYVKHGQAFRTFPSVVKYQLSKFLGIDVPEEDESSDIEKSLKSLRSIMERFPSFEKVRFDGMINDRFTAEASGDSGAVLSLYGSKGIFPPDKYSSVKDESRFESINSFKMYRLLMKRFKNTGDTNLLYLIERELEYFFQFYDDFKDVGPLDFWRELKWNVMRAHFLIDYMQVINAISYAYRPSPSFGKRFGEFLREHLSSLVSHVSPILQNKQNYYRRTLCLLHFVVLGRNNKEFFTKSYKTTLEFLKTIMDYQFDNSGMCIMEQFDMQHMIQPHLDKIDKFIKVNNLPETKEYKEFKRKKDKIDSVTRHSVRDDNLVINIGHTAFAKSHYKRANDNLILTDGNFAVLQNRLAYITVNGGSKIHSPFKHADEMSFTFRYDGHSYITDAGGGRGVLGDYAQSQEAHSAFYVSDLEYMLPEDSLDFSTLLLSKEEDDYVLLGLRHQLHENIIMSRWIMWIKPNVLIIADKAKGDSVHTFSQNFLIQGSKPVYDGNSVLFGESAENSTKKYLKITQQHNDFDLKKYFGTTKLSDPKHYRGSQIMKYTSLHKRKNFVYNIEGKTAEFLTIIEARHGYKSEVSITNAELSKRKLTVEYGDKIITEKLDFGII
jgi:hypothetical protein